MTSRPAGDDRRAVGRPRLSGTRRGLGRRIYGVVLFTYVVVLIIHMLALAGIEPMPRSARFDAAWPRILVEANAVSWFWWLTGLVVVGCLLAFGPMLREEYDDGGATSAPTRRWKPTGRIIYITGGAVGLVVALIGVIHLLLEALLASSDGPAWLTNADSFASAMTALGGSILGFAGLAWSLSARQDHTEWLEGAERRRERLETLRQTVADVGNVLAECDQLARQGFEILEKRMKSDIRCVDAGSASSLTRFDVLFADEERVKQYAQLSARTMAGEVLRNLVGHPTRWRAYEQFIGVIDEIARELQRDASMWLAQYAELRGTRLNGVSREVPIDLLSLVDDLELLYELFQLGPVSPPNGQSTDRRVREVGSLYLVAIEAARTLLKRLKTESESEFSVGSITVFQNIGSDEDGAALGLSRATRLLSELMKLPDQPQGEEWMVGAARDFCGPPARVMPGPLVRLAQSVDAATINGLTKSPKSDTEQSLENSQRVYARRIVDGYREVMTQLVLAEASRLRRNLLRLRADELVRRAATMCEGSEARRSDARVLARKVALYLDLLAVEPRRFWQHVRLEADPKVAPELWTDELAKWDAAIGEELAAADRSRQSFRGSWNVGTPLRFFRGPQSVPEEGIWATRSRSTVGSPLPRRRNGTGILGAVEYKRRHLDRVPLDDPLHRAATSVLQHARDWTDDALNDFKRDPYPSIPLANDWSTPEAQEWLSDREMRTKADDASGLIGVER